MQKNISLSELVQEEFVFLQVEGGTWESLLQNIAGLLLQAGAVKESYAAALIQREQEYPTGLPLGKFNFALPHTYPQHILRHAVAVAVPKHPVAFRSMEDPEQLLNVSVVVCPLLEKMDDSIKLLPPLMKFFASEQTIERIQAAKSKSEILSLIQNWTDSL